MMLIARGVPLAAWAVAAVDVAAGWFTSSSSNGSEVPPDVKTLRRAALNASGDVPTVNLPVAPLSSKNHPMIASFVTVVALLLLVHELAVVEHAIVCPGVTSTGDAVSPEYSATTVAQAAPEQFGTVAVMVQAAAVGVVPWPTLTDWPFVASATVLSVVQVAPQPEKVADPVVPVNVAQLTNVFALELMFDGVVFVWVTPTASVAVVETWTNAHAAAAGRGARRSATHTRQRRRRRVISARPWR